MAALKFPIGATPARLELARRGATAIAAYLLTALISLGAIALLARRIDDAALSAFLVYVLVSTLAAGIEPGTGKEAALAGSGAKLAVGRAFLGASIGKAVLASPAFGLLWLFAAGGPIELRPEMALAPALVVLGFVATDMRVLLDANGRHAAAIWLKQGSLALAILVAAAILAVGGSLLVAATLASLARLGWTTGFLVRLQAGAPAQTGTGRVWPHLMTASAIGALAASVDRMFALRMLEAGTANAFVFAYEILSKFWLIPYLIGPILFVKLAQGEGARMRRFALLLTAGLGLPYLGLAAALPLLPLPLLPEAGFGSIDLALFGLAILIASFNQLRVVALQALGRARLASISAAGGLIVALAAFPLLIEALGAHGLFVAWLLKSLAEGAILHFPDRRSVR